MIDLFGTVQKRGGLARWRVLAGAGVWVALLAGVAPTAWAQNQRSVYPDDSVVAKDALVRVRELHEAGNTAEALRVLQSLLDSDADRLLVSEADTDIFFPVRRHVHDLLLASPDLLARYREQEEPRAAQLVSKGELASVERSRLLTPSGFEAALRLAQLELEAARFESARLVLQPLEGHPDRAPGTVGCADSAGLAGVIAAYLARDGGRPEVKAWAARWSQQAGLNANAAIPEVASPATLRPVGRSPLSNFAEVPTEPVSTPLQSVVVDRDALTRLSEPEGERDVFGAARFPTASWVFPTVAGSAVYATDGVYVGAWDAATLGQLWRAKPANAPAAFSWGSDEAVQFAMGMGRTELEDAASVTVGGGVVVTATGLPASGSRSGDRRIHAFDAATGAVLWSADLSNVDQRINGTRDASNPCVVRGPAVIDSGTAVFAMRKAGQQRRITSLYLAGLDLYTGEVRWVRLVGGYGTNPWGRTATRPEAMLLDRGVVYRSDDMGITGAYEAATGRPVWVRLSPTKNSIDFNVRGEPSVPPFAMHQPVADGESVIVLEAAFSRLVRLSMADGALLAQRDGSVLGSPNYLVRVGGYLAGVSSSRVAFVPVAEFDTAGVRLSQAYNSPGIMGRCIAAGEKLLVPVTEGMDETDPARPDEAKRLALGAMGNTVIAPAADGVPAHLLVADRARLYTFVRWEDARDLLERRVAQRSKDPLPLITFAELAHHVGKNDLVPGLADRALALLDRSAPTEDATAQRAQLFDLLIGMMVQSRRAWNTPAPVESGRGAPIRDPARLDEVLERAARAADSPPQQVAALFERAWLRGVEKRWPQAVEALQQVLLDPSLGEVVIENDFADPKADAALPSAVSTAHDRAANQLAAMLRECGAGAYAAFDQEAARELAALPAAAGAAECTTLARRYPTAAVTPELWRRAAAADQRAGRTAEARLALGLGLSAAEFSAAIGRSSQTEVIAQLAGELLPLADGPNDTEPTYRLLRRLAEDYQGLQLTVAGRLESAAAAADGMALTLAKRTSLPRIGRKLSQDGVQALAAWRPMESMSRSLPGSACGSLVMMSESSAQVALWATSAEDGRLRQIWSRPFEARPTVVRLTANMTILFWPTTSGGFAEAIANVGGGAEVGTTLWKTQEFGGLFPPAEAPTGSDQFATPIDGKVRLGDVILQCDQREMVVVQRRGRAAAFSLETGKTMWSKQLSVTRVFEAELCGEFLVIGGTRPLSPEDGRWTPVISSYSLANGAEKSEVGKNDLGDHPRWIRATGQGDAVAATASGLIRFNPADGVVGWSQIGIPGQGSVGGWVVGGAVFVLTPDPGLWRVGLADGVAARRGVDTKGRLSFGLTARVTGDRLAVACATGMLVVDESGKTVGADALDTASTRIEQPEIAEDVFVAMEADIREALSSTDEVMLRVFLFDNPTGKLLNVERLRLYDTAGPIALIDGKIIVPAGAVTLVVDAPVK